MAFLRGINIAVLIIYLVPLILNAFTSFSLGWVDVGDSHTKTFLGVFNYCASTVEPSGVKKNEISCLPYPIFYNHFVENCMHNSEQELDIPDDDEFLKSICEEGKEQLKLHDYPSRGVKHMQPLAALGFCSAVLFLLFFYFSTVWQSKAVARFIACSTLVVSSVLGAITMVICKSQVLKSSLAIYLTGGTPGKLFGGYTCQGIVIALYALVLVVYTISWFMPPKTPANYPIAYTRVVTQVNQPLVSLKVSNNYPPQPANYVNPQGFSQPLLAGSNTYYVSA